MSKDHTLTKSTNPISRNHPTLWFWLRWEGRPNSHFSVKVDPMFMMFIILSNSVWASWYLIVWLEIIVQSSTMVFWTVIFFKLTLESHCLVLRFRIADFKNYLDSVILQKCQWLSNQSLKHNLPHLPSVNITPNFS